jgi:glycosyltransferase involved in cell wall biosynthesis
VKVLFVCPFVPWPLVNGGKIRTYHLVRSAARLAEIHLRIVSEPDQPQDAADALRPLCASLAFFERARPSAVQRWTRPKLERWFHSPALHAAVERDLASGGFHLVHLDELLLARVVPPDRRISVIQHHHKLDTLLYDNLSAAEGPKRHFDLWKLRRLEAESARRYRHHLLCSREDAEVLRRRHGALDCGVVPSGFDPTHFAPSEPPVARDPRRLVFVGSMDYGPNADAAVHFVRDVLPLVRARRDDVVLEIVGGEPTPEVRALAGPGVTVTGRVPDVRPYLERAGVVVVPLRIGGGTRLKIVEALALRAPLVSTATGAEGLGLVDGEHLLLADAPELFAQRVLELLSDPARACALGERGAAFVQRRYRWDALASDLVEYWEHVVYSGALTPSR